MNTENLSTLKIHKLSKDQYDRELAAGNIDPNALYLTPDEGSEEFEIKLQNTNISYGTCSTAADVVEKVVSLTGNTQWSLAVGSLITVKFDNTNTATAPTLNVNGTGAYPIWYNNAEYTSASSYGGYANRPMLYQFNGTHWVFISWSYDTNSDTKVQQDAAITTAGEYPVILAYSTSTSKVTNTVKKTSTLKYNPSTQILTAPTFKGALDGNAKTATSADTATTATKATQDASGNVITSTYETKANATSKLTEAKTYADTAATNAANKVKNDLLNGAGGAYDTLKELGDLIDENTDAIEALEAVAVSKADANKVAYITDNNDSVSVNISEDALTTDSIVDNLNSTSKTSVLSANQGRVLNDSINELSKQIDDEVSARESAIATEKLERQIEISAERARIDTFTSLAEGSTTGDAELIDARIGFDGYTHGSVGSAIRKQISMLANAFELEASDSANKFDNDFDVTGKIDITTGADSSASTLHRTSKYHELWSDFDGTVYIGYSAKTSTSEQKVQFFFYDENKSYLGYAYYIATDKANCEKIKSGGGETASTGTDKLAQAKYYRVCKTLAWDVPIYISQIVPPSADEIDYSYGGGEARVVKLKDSYLPPSKDSETVDDYVVGVVSDNKFDSNFNAVGKIDITTGVDSSASSLHRTAEYHELWDGFDGTIYFGIPSKTDTSEQKVQFFFYDGNKNYLGCLYQVAEGTPLLLKNTDSNWTYKSITSETLKTARYYRVCKTIAWDVQIYISQIRPSSAEEIDYTYEIGKIPVSGEATVSSAKKLQGKVIVNFGDSIFGKRRPPEDISTKLAELTGATVHNCGFGGCHMSNHWATTYNAFSMCNLADSIVTKNWTSQDIAIADTSSQAVPSYFSEALAILKGLDFNNVDIITIAYGTNDFTNGDVLENTTNIYDKESFSGALHYSIETLLTSYPHLKIFICSPTYRFWMNDSNVFTEDSDTYLNTKNVKLTDFVEKTKEVAKEYKLPFIDNYYSLGINKFNRSQYFSATDGTHHLTTGCHLIAEHMANELF